MKYVRIFFKVLTLLSLFIVISVASTYENVAIIAIVVYVLLAIGLLIILSLS